jgi:hypothetical protein
MFGVTGIGDGLKEVRVTGGAADILGWTGSGAGDAGSDARRGIDGDQALEGDAVLPVVTEIVEVEEALIGHAAEVAEPNRGLVE